MPMPVPRCQYHAPAPRFGFRDLFLNPRKPIRLGHHGKVSIVLLASANRISGRIGENLELVVGDHFVDLELCHHPFMRSNRLGCRHRACLVLAVRREGSDGRHLQVQRRLLFAVVGRGVSGSVAARVRAIACLVYPANPPAGLARTLNFYSSNDGRLARGSPRLMGGRGTGGS